LPDGQEVSVGDSSITLWVRTDLVLGAGRKGGQNVGQQLGPLFTISVEFYLIERPFS